MTVQPFVPDLPAAIPQNGPADPGDFARAVDALGSALERAQTSEDAFASKRGSLIDAVYDRARADVALAVAVAGATRATQSLSTILNMSV